MDSTYKGNEPQPGGAWQPTLFDQGDGTPDRRDEIKTDVSADPNPLPSEPLRGLTPDREGPVLVREREPRQDPVWAQRLKLVVFVLFCIELGMLLAVLPWTRVWTENSLLTAYPSIRAFLQHNFVRGAITGLGLIDIWLGIREAVTYHETGHS